jgi:hypothetical protein
MLLIGVGERRLFSGERDTFAIFSKEDGEFELSITVEQMAILLSESGQISPPKRRTTPRPHIPDNGSAGQEVEVDAESAIRLARFEDSSEKDDDIL